MDAQGDNMQTGAFKAEIEDLRRKNEKLQAQADKQDREWVEYYETEMERVSNDVRREVNE